MMEPMWVRYRRCVAHAIVAVVALVAVAGCNASRPNARPSTTDAGPGPPVEAPDDVATVGPTTAPTTGLTSTGTTTTTEPPGGAAPTTTAFPGTPPVSTLPRPSEAEWLAFDAALRDRLLDAGDFAFGVAVSIDGESVHVAS